MQSLFSGKEGRYWYGNGLNEKAIYAWILALILPVCGLFIPSLSILADAGWMVGFVLALIIYPILMKGDKASLLSPEENEKITEQVDVSKDTV